MRVIATVITLACLATSQRIEIPDARDGHTLGYHPSTASVVLFGGYDGTRFRRDTWIRDNAGKWTRRFPQSAPSARVAHAMCVDPTGDLILFGGNQPNKAGGLADTWRWNGVSWRSVLVPGPSARWGHRMVYDAARARVVLFGGYDPQARRSLNDTWEFDGKVWSRISPATSPPPRRGHMMAFDRTRNRTVVYGGWDGQATFADTWEWNGAIWLRTADGPVARRYAAFAFDGSHLVMHGGERMGPPTGETWTRDSTGTWRRAVTGVSPGPRRGHAAAETRGSVFLFGGWHPALGVLGWEYSWTGSLWTGGTHRLDVPRQFPTVAAADQNYSGGGWPIVELAPGRHSLTTSVFRLRGLQSSHGREVTAITNGVDPLTLGIDPVVGFSIEGGALGHGTFLDCVIKGGIWPQLTGSRITVRNSRIEGGTIRAFGDDFLGHEIHISDSTVRRCSIRTSSPPQSSPGNYALVTLRDSTAESCTFSSDQWTSILCHGIVWNHTATGPNTSLWGWVQGQPNTSDPLFVATDDLHLTALSPCRSGGPTVSSDFEAQQRNGEVGGDAFNPTLYVVGDVIRGSTVDVRAIGHPASAVLLAVSLSQTLNDVPLVIPGGAMFELESPYALLPLGQVPANGVLTVRLPVPLALPVGHLVPMQALIGVSLTQPVWAHVR